MGKAGLVFRRVVQLIVLIGLLVISADFAPDDVSAEAAIPAVLRAFDRYSVVALGEMHWSRAAGDFYLSLVRDPEFSRHVNTVVLECGNSRYQQVLDRYINGEKVPADQISRVWRDTTKVISWESPIYAGLITAIREVNRELPPERRIRVLAADSPIDWGRIATHADWEAASNGDKFIASLIEREVLQKNRKALVIMGVNHVTHGGNWRGGEDVTSLLEKRSPRSVYVALSWGIPGSGEAEIKNGPVPSLSELHGTRLGRANYFGRHAQEAADAYIYLGASGEIARPDWAALQSDKALWAELQRRHNIQFGCPIYIERWNQLGRPCPN